MMKDFPFRNIVIIPVLVLLIVMTSITCDKITIEYSSPPLPRHQKDEKPNTPVPLGCIRAYFGDYYRSFTQNIEKVQPVDSFSNVYFYGSCSDGQIKLIRCDSDFVLAINIPGYSLDSLPLNKPLPEVYGKYPEINLYPFGHLNWGDPSYYSLAYYVKKCVFIFTDNKDDVLTGTFEGMLISSTGALLPLSDGEFKIKVFRKKMPCVQHN